MRKLTNRALAIAAAVAAGGLLVTMIIYRIFVAAV